MLARDCLSSFTQWPICPLQEWAFSSLLASKHIIHKEQGRSNVCVKLKINKNLNEVLTVHKHKALKARLWVMRLMDMQHNRKCLRFRHYHVTEYKLTVQQHDCNCAEAVLIVKQLEPYPKIVLVMTPSGCKMHNKRPFFFLFFLK